MVEIGLYPSREKAKQAIESGRVEVNGQKVTKPALLFDENCTINALPFEFVSRGGFKLQKALEEFEINLSGRTVLDVGASTGGFTDVCLQNGAEKVFAVDTGEGQLVESLRKDGRVVNLENTNFLTLKKEELKDVSFVCVDVSFVSLTKLAWKFAELFADNVNFAGVGSVDIVALIKPQFECGLQYARKHKGVVKDEKIRQKAIKDVVDAFDAVGFKNRGIVTSPIKGGDGNVEFLAWFSSK